MQHLAENRDSGVVSLGWYVCVYVCVCHAKLEIFPRFSSRAPGKCLITSGFVLSAMIILFYAVLFSYSGLRMKALIFHWSTHWGTFCVYIWIHSFLFNLLVPIGARFNICATAFSVQVSETGGGALVFNLRAETEQTPRLIDSKWRFCWNRFSVGLTAGSQWPFLSPQTEHRIKGVIYREEVAAGDGTPRCWKQSSTSVFPITWSFFWNNRVSWWWFRGHRSDTDSSHHLSLFVCFFCRGDLQHDNGLQLHDNAHVGPQCLGNGHEQPGDASHWNDWSAAHARYHTANQRATNPWPHMPFCLKKQNKTKKH